ncbi:MAG: DUF1643 domain-containing protein [Pyramidobacter sp.]|uniref:DUF1643 domain-containing protein n=1 Tax=Pyramidobacter sp. TaxID=1943581 RepID=UPI002A81FF1F|nr:DUF1643 domain-containing protein [Pyramidobacter sp.]MDY4032318.1 DUF1643 domain-containing protein [Pyramidobacter sp.]
MISEKLLMRTEAVYSDDKTRRYLLHREWDAKKPKALIIMTNPSTAGSIALDFTTMYILNNITQLDFGSVAIANLVSKMTRKLSILDDMQIEEDNFACIVKAAQKADKVIVAWGKIGETSIRTRMVQDALIARLEPFKGKLCMIASQSSEAGFHPLAPQIRFYWDLVNYERPQYEQPHEETEASDTKDRSEAPVKPVPERKKA